MDYQIIIDSMPSLLRASLVTLYVATAGILIGQVFGAVVCMLSLLGYRSLQMACAVFVSFFRGVPTLVKVLLVYYLLPGMGIAVPAVVSAIIALGLMSAAYVSEIYRGALQAIPPGQVEAARMLGMSTTNIWRRILIPQAMRLSVPALINEANLTLKASSLVSVVGVAELASTSGHIAAATFRPIELGLAAGAIYLVFSFGLSWLGQGLERRLAVGVAR